MKYIKRLADQAIEKRRSQHHRVGIKETITQEP